MVLDLVMMGLLVVFEVGVPRPKVVESEVTGSDVVALETAWSGTIVRCLRFPLSLVVGVSTQ